jgi:hypothetical protein
MPNVSLPRRPTGHAGGSAAHSHTYFALDEHQASQRGKDPLVAGPHGEPDDLAEIRWRETAPFRAISEACKLPGVTAGLDEEQTSRVLATPLAEFAA